MDESSSQEPNKDESVDLSELKSFSFGTQWSEASKSKKGGGGDKPRFHKGPRGDRPDRRSGGAPGRSRDRRPSRPDRPSDGGAAPADQGGKPFREGGRRPGRGRHQGGGHGHAPAFMPYASPVFDVCFYPEDNCFSAIIKAMRGNHLTYELFHVAKLFMEKPDRFIVSITRKAEKGEKPEKVFICLADNMPFATEEEAIMHVLNHHGETYFEVEEIEVEPPSGNFSFINRCPFTKELLGPPNYHKYEETLRNHHRTRLPNMAFEKLQSSIETVREEEVVTAWLESQKKATRYTTKAAEGEEPQAFQSVDEVLGYLRTTLKAKIVKQVNYARVSGTILEKFKETEAFKAVDGERQRQLRFPLDTANAIRGRMRREKFSIYKKGSKGVTYVCATKRNFRAPGQVMAPDLDRIIRFVEANQMIKAKEMGPKYEEWLKADAPDVSYDEKKMLRDLHWLVADGYVSHFEDDSLFSQPILETGNAGPENASSKETPAVAKESTAAPEASASASVAEAATPSEVTEAAAESAPEVKAEEPETKVEESSSEVAAEAVVEDAPAVVAEEEATPVEVSEAPGTDQPAETAEPTEEEKKEGE